MLSADEISSVFGGRHEAMYGILASSQHRAKVFQDASEIERAGFVTDVGATTASEALRNHIAGRQSHEQQRTANGQEGLEAESSTISRTEAPSSSVRPTTV